MTSQPSVKDDIAGDLFGSKPPTERRGHFAGPVLRFVRRKKAGAAGLFVVLLVLTTAAIGPTIAPYTKDEAFEKANPLYDPDSADLDAIAKTRILILSSPSWEHPLGTDSLGRDLVTRLLYGARISVVVGLLASMLAILAGFSLGVISGYAGGWIDLVLQRFVDALVAMPALVLLLLLVQIGPPSVHLTVIALAVIGVGPASRVVRSAALSVRSEAYVLAARSIGVSHSRMIVHHVAPNVVGPALVVFSAAIGTNILAEAGLAFLGLSPPGPSWGRMIAEGRTFLDKRPLMSIAGGGAITVTVLGFNILGDALRDYLDPRQRNR